MITELYNHFAFLLDSGVLKENEREFYRRVSFDMDAQIAADALKRRRCRIYNRIQSSSCETEGDTGGRRQIRSAADRGETVRGGAAKQRDSTGAGQKVWFCF